MSVTFTILAILVVIASILLTLIVLLQNGKGGGLASNFTAGNQAFGVRQTADLLEKITWGLIAFIFVISVVATFTMKPKELPTAPIATEIPAENSTIEMQDAPAAAEAPVEATAPAEGN